MTNLIPQAQPPPARSRWGWRWRRNPLRRPTDLLEAWIGLILAVAVAAAAPPAALAAGGAAHRSLEHVASEQARTGRQVTAVLVRDAAEHPASDSRTAEEGRHPALVRYTAPDGTTRTATTGVRSGQVAGDTVRVWIDGAGDLAEPPMTSDEIRSSATGWALLAAIGVAVAGGAAYALARRVLDRRRAAEWDEAWARTAPRWTASP
ncbi:Rv1733c family protein [Streptomyces macrosporus]|uniref:Uncharacterized protein n=1 Tax=Streptomyces macrosporus TaxID=44032 RepID=A0ABP5WKI6_9ACTN